MEFVQKFTPPDFKVKNFTISPYFNSFSGQKHKKWVKMEKFTPLAKILHCRRHWQHGQIPPLLMTCWAFFCWGGSPSNWTLSLCLSASGQHGHWSGLSNIDGTLATSEHTLGRQSDEECSPSFFLLPPPPLSQPCDPPCVGFAAEL